MTKSETIWVRLDPAAKAAIERAALADHRSVSSLAAKIISEWLAKNEIRTKLTKRG